jgi:hypothetical protein
VTLPPYLDVLPVLGADAPADGPWDLLLDVPHGATRTADWDRLRVVLRGDYAADLRDFFFVNTDAGAPEVAFAVARRWVGLHRTARAVVLRSLLPRTFVDCNRIVASEAAPGMTPGLGPWVHDDGDRALLLDLHARWWRDVQEHYHRLSPGGLAVQVHTYAPRSVDVVVDEHVVANLRAAWSPEQRDRWPLRPEIDLITRTQEGVRLCEDAVVDGVAAGLRGEGFGVSEGATYPLHPGTTGYLLARDHAPRVLCFEVRRDLVAEPWDPFAEMRIGGAVERVARGVVGGILAGRSGGSIDRASNGGA